MRKYSKRLLLGIAGMAVVFAAAGCQNAKSSSKEQTQSEAQTQKKEETMAEEKSTTRTVHTVMGDVEVPADPQRVVVNWYIGDALALDLNVVGYSGWSHETMPFYKEMKSSVEIKNWEPEEVMTLEPDLIISYQPDDYDKFKGVAPVIIAPENDLSSLERVLFLGESTGRKKEAEAVVETFETKLAASKEKLEGDRFKDKSFSITEDWGSGSYGVYYETESRGGTILYKYLGMKKPEKMEQLMKDGGDGRGGLSYEVAAEYFGDYMIWFRHSDSEEDVPSEYETSTIWNSIPAVQSKQVVTIPGKMIGLFYYSDVLSLTAQLDYIVDALNSTGK